MIAIRSMTGSDLDSVLDLEAATPEAPHWKQAVYQGFLAESEPPRRIFLAEDGGVVLGFIAGQIIADICELQSIVVAASSRRSGLGSALLATFIEWARKRGAICVELEVRVGNSSAIGFYQRVGFKKDGLRQSYYQQPDEDGALMSRPLK